MTTKEVDTNSNARPSSSPNSLSPSSNPSTSVLPQLFQDLITTQRTTNEMSNSEEQETRANEAVVESRPSITADGSSSVGTNSSRSIGLAAAPVGVTSAVGVNDVSAPKEGVRLGLEALERQQEEAERRRKTLQSSIQRHNPFDSSPRRQKRSKRRPQDATYKDSVPSSVQLTGEDQSSTSSFPPEKKMTRVESFGKLLRTPLKQTQNLTRTISNKIKSKSNKAPEGDTRDENEPYASDSSATYNKSIISGYLNKRGRQGKWQRRWFESDGKSLLYFKSNKRTKLLATLDLLYIGAVAMDSGDPTGCTFYIEVAGRDYHLNAETREHAVDWVISMNRVREARMEIGGLKLIEPVEEDAEGMDGDYTPRVVMVAKRKRAKGLGREEFNSLPEVDSNLALNNTTFTTAVSPTGTGSMISSNTSVRLRARNGVLVRWKKRRNAFQNLARRLSRWAQRVKMIRFAVKDDEKNRNQQLRDKRSRQESSLQNEPPDLLSHEQGTNVPSGSWGVGSGRGKLQKLPSRKKHDEHSSRENSASGDVDSQSKSESINENNKIDDESNGSSCVV